MRGWVLIVLLVGCGVSPAPSADAGRDAGADAAASSVDSGPPPCRFEDCGGVFISEVFIGTQDYVELEATQRVILAGRLRSNVCSSGVAQAIFYGSFDDPILLEPGERYVVEFDAPARSFGPTSDCHTGVDRCSTTMDALTGGTVYLQGLGVDNILGQAASEDNVCARTATDAWCYDHGRCVPTPGEPNEPAL